MLECKPGNSLEYIYNATLKDIDTQTHTIRNFHLPLKAQFFLYEWRFFEF